MHIMYSRQTPGSKKVKFLDVAPETKQTEIPRPTSVLKPTHINENNSGVKLIRPAMDLYNFSTSSSDLSTGNTGSGFIDNATFTYLFITFRIVLNPAMSVLALLATIINVVTFSRMTLSQGVNQNLLILSTSDLVLAVFGVVGNSCYVLRWLGINTTPVRFTLYILMWVVAYPVNASAAVTTIIAAVRCLSVIMPITFRTVVTPQRQVVAIALGCSISWSVPLYTHLLINVYTKKGNNSLGIPSSSEINKQMVVFDYFRNTFFYTCFTIIILSGVFLSIALRKSSSFQASATASTTDGQTKASSRREVQVVKTVILLLVIFVTCNLPFLFLSLLRLMVPGFSPSGKFRNEKLFVDSTVATGIHLNVGLNTFVYLKYNSKFNKILTESLSRVSLKTN
ncbi:chemosensory receptor B [Elysia marginata]|uniref:Chemosensory receptor B n=1 Tax=Elysia marginata TaxID=1093978 RepID=A0AAV4GH49_9GAST|nr:chemosensory receptor B [Elysia marginata]